MEDHAKPPLAPELLGGVIGLIVALGLGGLRVFNMAFGDSTPFNPLRFREEAFGNIVFTLVLATPYLAALFSTRLPAGTRWLVLLPAAIVSLPAIFISFSLIGFLFIPAIGFLVAATGRSFNNNSVSGVGKTLGIAMTITIIATVFGAGTLLFQSRNDARGWRYTTSNDGHIEWESVPQVPGRIGVVIQAPSGGPSGGTSGGTATSDIITATEAANGGALLLLAWTEIGALGLYAVRRWPDEHSPSLNSS